MDDEIAVLRLRVEDALRRVEAAATPETKAQWQALADQYLARLAQLEGHTPPKPKKPRFFRRKEKL